MQRAVDKTEHMKARASAVEELEQAGTFEISHCLAPARTRSTASLPSSAPAARSTTS